jgi:hypothetical protein
MLPANCGLLFSRAISVGVARTTNLAIRRLQLGAAARVGVPDVSSIALREPFAPASPRRSIPKSPLLSLQTEQRMRAQLAVVLQAAVLSEDLRESSSLKSGSDQLCVDQLCVDADTSVVD